MNKQNGQNEKSKAVVSMLVLSVGLTVVASNAAEEIAPVAKKLRFGVSELTRLDQRAASVANVDLGYNGGVRGARSRPDAGTNC